MVVAAPAPDHAIARGRARRGAIGSYCRLEVRRSSGVPNTPTAMEVWSSVGDEGRPRGADDQELASNHRRAAVVKSDGGERRGKGGTMIPSGEVQGGERSEPSMNCRNRIVGVRTRSGGHPGISRSGDLKPGSDGARLEGGVNLDQALAGNGRTGTWRCDVKGGASGRSPEIASTDAEHRGRTVRSREEGVVMALDQRGCGVPLWQAANR